MAEQFLNIYPGCFFNLTDSKSTTSTTGRTKSTGHPLNKKCIAARSSSGRSYVHTPPAAGSCDCESVTTCNLNAASIFVSRTSQNSEPAMHAPPSVVNHANLPLQSCGGGGG